MRYIKYLLFVIIFIPHLALAAYTPFLESGVTNLGEVNLYRQKHHLNALILSKDTCLLAYQRLDEVQQDFSHNGFYERKPDLIKTGIWRENLAKGFYVNVQVMRAWELSPSHNQNLLGMAKYGCMVGANSYWVLIMKYPL